MTSHTISLSIILLSTMAGLLSCSTGPDGSFSPAGYVDPLIGSGAHGHVFVGANVPFGMVQLGPTSITQAWDFTSGYHESDSTVIGFSHTHLSGTGVGDLFDITVMPVTGDVTYARGRHEDPGSGLWSLADRSREVARAGYYSVPLTRYGILAEMTATERTGMHRYTFPASDSAAIVIDMQNGGCWDRPVDIVMQAENDSIVSGHRFSTGWSSDQKVYFVAEFSRPFESFTLHGAGDMYGRASFKTAEGEQIMMKVGISPNSIEGARANLNSENPDWDFDKVASAATDSWNRELGKIQVESTDPDKLKTFYTALYHTMFMPSLFSDAGQTDDYTIYSLWDTYRAEMPLLTIFQPERSAAMVNSMLGIFDRQGRLPVWHLWGCETDCMVGNPGIIPVADAVVKEIEGIDRNRALRAMIATSNDTARGGGLRSKYGYIPCDLFNEAVAYDMEYAVADGAIANAAKAMGDTATANEYTKRSRSWRNYFDPATNFVRGRDSKGGWRTPFDPFATTHRVDDYCEGTAWQYLWLVPQDVDGLIESFGSREAMLTKLDSLFTASSTLNGDASPDITGLIGQYAHGNEPGHHIPYLYAMLGQPEKGADRIREILHDMYGTGRDGLCGNEDAGQMSAWYVLSALGFYEVEPASGRYWFGSPIFDRAEIAVPSGRFVIRTVNNSPENRYIRSVKLNGQPYTLPYINHSDIMRGGELVMEMGK